MLDGYVSALVTSANNVFEIGSRKGQMEMIIAVVDCVVEVICEYISLEDRRVFFKLGNHTCADKSSFISTATTDFINAIFLNK